MHGVITANKRSLRQGNIFTDVCQSFCSGGLCMMSLPVWLRGPMFLPGGSLSRLVSVQVGLCSGSLCPGGSLSRGSLSRGLCPGRSLSRGSLSRGSRYKQISLQGVSAQGVPVQGGLCPRGLCLVKSGQYASYWNAFLLCCYGK